MITLAIDSSASTLAAAVCDGERVLAQIVKQNTRAQSEELFPEIARLMRECGISYGDIDLFAAASGPGSYTGLRIGISLIKGIAFGRGKPCVGVSSLASLAENYFGEQGLICPVMDARRERFYCALFRVSGGIPERLTDDDALPIGEFIETAVKTAKAANLKILLCGDGSEIALAEFAKRGIATDCAPEKIAPTAEGVARVALCEYKKGVFTTDSELRPVYLRKPHLN
jgi:tRNA threonylcarbamoyladenosine biosynthesis protein TsaB